MDFMLDIETLDTRPSSIVLSLGFVPFDKDGARATFYANFDINAQEAVGRTLSVGTVEFWMQHVAAYPNKDRWDVREALVAIREFVHSYSDDRVRIWAKPPSFDLVILESLFKDFKVDLPWNYKVPRCVRTMQDLLTKDEMDAIEAAHKGVIHNALDDCLLQIEIVNKARLKCTAP